MERVKILFPDYNPRFVTTIPIRVSDLNYGNHVGNDAILSLMHEARMQMLASNNYSEMNAGGNSMIMGDVMIAYKGEAFYGDKILIKIFVEEVTRKTFNLLYHLSTERNGKITDIAHAKTGMACFDYSERRISMMTAELKQFLTKETNE